jgi:hypothetical protein
MFFYTPSIEKFFSNITLPYDCEFFVTQPLVVNLGRETSLSLIEMYQDHPTRSLQKEPVATWTSSSGLAWSAVPLLKRRADLHGTAIRVGVSNEVDNGPVLNSPLRSLLKFGTMVMY